MRRHDYEKEAGLRARVRANPSWPKGHTELGAWLLRAGRLAQAREALQAGLSQTAEPSRLHHLLGLILVGAGDLDSGIRHLERAAEREPTRFEHLRDLALALGAAGRTASSVEALRQAMAVGGKDAQNLEWFLRLGEKVVVESGGRAERRPPVPPRRAAVIERLVTRDPEVAESLLPREGEPSVAQRETLRAARRALARLAAENPSYADLHFGLSLIAEQLGEVDRAIEAAEKALSVNPRYAEACLLAVRLYEKAGRPDVAEKRCRQAADLRPRWVDAHLRLGRLLREQGRKREAADVYRRALDIDAGCPEARQGVDILEAALAAEGGGA